MRNTLTIVIAGLLVGAGYAISYVQQESFDKRQAEIANARADRLIYALQQKAAIFYDKKPKEGEAKSGIVIGTYAKAIGDALDQPEGYSAAYHRALSEYDYRTEAEDSTPRIQSAASQALVELTIIEIEQNRKIIELLRKLAK